MMMRPLVPFLMASMLLLAAATAKATPMLEPLTISLNGPAAPALLTASSHQKAASLPLSEGIGLAMVGAGLVSWLRQRRRERAGQQKPSA